MEMAYSNKFAICVLVGNTIMKELPDGSVGLPFGTEYKLRLFNKHDRRAVAKISLDTENVSEGGFVVAPHSQIDIERRADRDTAFKFVELGSDEAIENGKPMTNQSREMGLIEVNFYLEKERPVAPVVEHHHHHSYPSIWPTYPPYSAWWSTHTVHPSGILRGSSCGGSSLSGSSLGAQSDGLIGAAVYSCSTSVNNQQDGLESSVADWSNLASGSIKTTAKLDGCTVDGSNTGIHYNTVFIDIESTSTLIKLFLQGFKQNLVKAASKSKPQKRRKK